MVPTNVGMTDQMTSETAMGMGPGSSEMTSNGVSHSNETELEHSNDEVEGKTEVTKQINGPIDVIRVKSMSDEGENESLEDNQDEELFNTTTTTSGNALEILQGNEPNIKTPNETENDVENDDMRTNDLDETDGNQTRKGTIE